MHPTHVALAARALGAALLALLALMALPGPYAAAQGPDSAAADPGAAPVAPGAGYGYTHGAGRVRVIQRRLIRLGYAPGPVDGLFGPRTEAAVRRLQQRGGLAPDGVVGPRTTALLARLEARARRAAAIVRRPAPSRTAPLSADRRPDRLARAKADGRSPLGRPERQAAPTSLPGALVALAAVLLLGGLLLPPALRRRRPSRRSSASRGNASAPHGGRPAPDPHRASGHPANGGPATSTPANGHPANGMLATRTPANGHPANGRPATRELADGHPANGTLATSTLANGQPANGTPATRELADGGTAATSEPADGGPANGRPATRELANGHPANGRPATSELTDGGPAPSQPADGLANGWPAALPAARPRTPALGYVSVGDGERLANGDEYDMQAHAIEAFCARRGLRLVRIIRDVAPEQERLTARPGLHHGFEALARGDARALVVHDLGRLTRSPADLAVLLRWFADTGRTLIALETALDTSTPAGRHAARALIEVGRWEGQRAFERRARAAARSPAGAGGRPAVRDLPDLHGRIERMRADGMSLQAIADALNAEGVPTLRGGIRWRPSSVQAAVGYKRPSGAQLAAALPLPAPAPAALAEPGA